MFDPKDSRTWGQRPPTGEEWAKENPKPSSNQRDHHWYHLVKAVENTYDQYLECVAFQRVIDKDDPKTLPPEGAAICFWAKDRPNTDPWVLDKWVHPDNSPYSDPVPIEAWHGAPWQLIATEVRP